MFYSTFMRLLSPDRTVKRTVPDVPPIPGGPDRRLGHSGRGLVVGGLVRFGSMPYFNHHARHARGIRHRTEFKRVQQWGYEKPLPPTARRSTHKPKAIA